MENPDILHAHSPVLNAIPAIRAAKKCRLPLVYWEATTSVYQDIYAGFENN